MVSVALGSLQSLSRAESSRYSEWRFSGWPLKNIMSSRSYDFFSLSLQHQLYPSYMCPREVGGLYCFYSHEQNHIKVVDKCSLIEHKSEFYNCG